MRKPCLLDVVAQPWRDVAVVDPAIGVVSPGALTSLDALRRSKRGSPGGRGRPSVASNRHPATDIQVPENGGCARRNFVRVGEWISFVGLVSGDSRENVILIAGAGLESRNEASPDSRRSSRAQEVGGFVPIVEIADDRHSFSVRRPDSEMRPAEALAPQQSSSKLFMQAQVRALVEKVQVLPGQKLSLSCVCMLQHLHIPHAGNVPQPGGLARRRCPSIFAREFPDHYHRLEAPGIPAGNPSPALRARSLIRRGEGRGEGIGVVANPQYFRFATAERGLSSAAESPEPCSASNTCKTVFVLAS